MLIVAGWEASMLRKKAYFNSLDIVCHIAKLL